MKLPTALWSGFRLAFTLLLLASVPAAAQQSQPAAPAATEAATGSELTWNGFVSASRTMNSNRPAVRRNGFRVFDFRDRTLELDVAEVAVQKAISKPGETGFRIDAEAGSTIPRVTAQSGLFRDAKTGEADDVDLKQAYASWIAPVGKGLRVDLGKFVTHMGYELIEGYDGWNTNHTRSFLFGYAIPFTHTGLRLSYPLTDKLSGQLHVVQGWDNFQDNNSAKSVGYQLLYALDPAWTITLNGMTGPEQTGNNGNDRSVLDVIVQWKASDTLSLGLNFDHGREQNALGLGADASWRGTAGYARVAVSKKWALNFRGEVFDDPDGARTGVAQTLREVTFTPEYRIDEHTIIRADLRKDWSSTASFFDGVTPADSQFTASINLMLVY